MSKVKQHDSLAKLNKRYIEIFIRSTLKNLQIYQLANDLDSIELSKYITDTINMANDVINGGMGTPKEATSFQCRIIDELLDFQVAMVKLMDPFNFLITPQLPNTVER
jgi:hypothetical protein